MLYQFLLTTVSIYILVFSFYANISKGLGNKAFFLQLRRFIPCILAVTVPPFLIKKSILSLDFLIPTILGIAWIITYPTLYFFTNKNRSVSFSYHLDIVFGLYLISFFVSLQIFLQISSLYNYLTIFLISIFEFILLLIPISQYIFFILYGECISTTGMMAIQQTDRHEALEFLTTLPLKLKIITATTLVAIFSELLYCNYKLLPSIHLYFNSFYSSIFFLLLILFLSYYLFHNTTHGVFFRTGIIELFLDVKNYFKQAGKYRKYHEENLSTLTVNVNNKKSLDHPQTIILIIGESASRDHMSLFSDYPRDTTPWLSKHQHDTRFFLFPNAYACWGQTVPVLERALTESNQYNNKLFNESFSILDIAKKAGYTTHWYSNQGRIGSADTQITLVAETADIAKWSQQDSPKKQYDDILLDYLDTVDTTKNNFIVLHLMGSHDNFQARYPEDFTIWGSPGKYNLNDNYDNSLAFTDKVLKEIYDFSNQKLNLQALIYFSDHATIPDKRRQPNFSGFATVRIPMFVYLSEKYQTNHASVTNSLRNNVSKPFTNDLIYDLCCSLLDIQSNHFIPNQSIASSTYNFNRTTLTTNLGKTFLSEDI